MARYFLLLFTLFGLSPAAAIASETDGTIDAAAKYAWGENIGWVNFGTPEGDVHVTDAGLTGDVWSENYGWIRLDPSTTTMVTNDAEGTLGGYAWGETLGWINFDGVMIDDEGNFSGYAALLGDGSLISFSCANTDSCAASNFFVATDWRKSSVREEEEAAPGGGGGGRPSRGPTGEEPDEEPGQAARVLGILDFNVMMVQWGSTACGNSADLNDDCSVDILDFNLLMVYWDLPYPI